MYSELTTFPMMAVGVFNIMFWTGFVAGHNLGLSCDVMLLTGVLFGGVGSYGVSRLERAYKGETRKHAPEESRPVEQSEKPVEPAYQA